jgi:HD-GYP domain-containing protein (c-di-GMP phosphodiesterase class II)
VYKPAFTHEESRAILLQGKGTQFDPDVIDAFMASEQKIVELKRRLADPCPDAQPGAAGIATPLNRPLAPTIASV